MSKAVIKPTSSVEKKNTLTTLSRKHQLYKLIVDSRGRPDALAINLYFDEFRSWYNHKKQYKGGKVINFPKLHSKGIHVCYRFLADRYGVSEETIRRKIVKLEGLGLLSRDFEQNINYGKALFNQLVIHIWQQTDYFYNPIGIDRAKVGELKPSTNHKYISSKYNTPHIHKNEDRGYPQNVDTYGTNVWIGIHTDEDTKTLRPVLREEKPPSYAKGDFSSVSSIIKTETNTRACDPIQQKHATFAPCFPSEQEQVAFTNQEEKAVELDRKNRSNEHTGLFAMSDLMAKVLNEPTKQEEITEMNFEELPKLTEKEERTILLSRALWQTFGEQRSGEIQDDYKFVEIHEHKVCIQAREMQLNDIEKAKIRRAIQSVYGEDVILAMQIIVSTTEKPTPSNENELVSPLSVRKTATWLDFKATIKTNSMITMLTDPVLKTIEIPGKVIIETVPFLIERLTSPGYLDELERSVFETGLTLELRASNPHPEYKNFNKEAIVISPEKILKDMEFRESCEPLVLSEILEEAKRNKEEQNNE